MATQGSSERRERLELAGDGALVTTALLAVLLSILLLVTEGVGDREVPVAIQIVGSLVTLVGGAAGPVVVWLMHKRKITLPAVVGALVGVPLAGAAFWVFVGFSTLLGWVLSPISTAEYFGPLAGAAVVASALVVAFVWLVVGAVRDLRASISVHRSLDIARLASAVVFAVYSSVIAVLALRIDGEILEAIAFALLGGIAGACMVTMADVLTRLTTPKPDKGGTAT